MGYMVIENLLNNRSKVSKSREKYGVFADTKIHICFRCVLRK